MSGRNAHIIGGTPPRREREHRAAAERGFTVQGWCPGALRPMMSGDGLVVRVRPCAGRLTRRQAAGIAAAARTHGNGLIDVSARANLQVRGVRAETHAAVVADLRALGLIEADVRAERRRNLLVTPFADAATDALAAALIETLAGAPELPDKFGFAVDTGVAPVMQAASADIRLERAATGGLILRCDGAALGAPVTVEEAPGAALALAHWFVEAGGVQAGRGRMAALTARGRMPEGALAGRAAPAPAPADPPPGPGLCAEGALVALAFGQMDAATLAALAALGDLRVTPWRMLLIEGLNRLPALPGLILRADDPLRRVTACMGSPGCLQAHRPTRPLARRLAPHVPEGKILHVSGCAKGCAFPARADVTLVATPAGFDLIEGGTAQDAPVFTALTEAELELMRGPA